MIDVGTLARIKAGEIAVYPGLGRLTESGAEFVDGRNAPFDVVILATGYRSGIAALFPGTTVPVDASGLPSEPIGRGALAGVFFVGFDMKTARRPLRTIAQQAAQAVACADRGDAGRRARPAQGVRAMSAAAGAD